MNAAARRTILVADDEPALRRLIARLLDRAGFRTVAVPDGAAALAALAAEPPPDAVVADATLPPDGVLPLLRTLQAAERPAAVVVTSGSTLAPDVEQALASCRGRFLRKPFEPSELVEALEAAVGPRGGRD